MFLLDSFRAESLFNFLWLENLWLEKSSLISNWWYVN